MKNIIKKRKYTLKLLKQLFLIALVVIVTYTTLRRPQAASLGVLTGIKYCTEILIPSLFPLMFLSKFIVKSNLLEFFKKPMNFITRFLFYLPGTTAPTILLSLIGGYPVGALGVKSLHDKKEINSEQLNRMMFFNVNSGPGFAINVIGFSLLKKPFLGIIILAVQIFISLSIGIFCGVYARLTNKPMYSKKVTNNKEEISFSEAFIETTSQVSYTLINMCALIIIFSYLIFIIKEWNILQKVELISSYFKIEPYNILFLFTSSLEITSGCSLITNKAIPLPIIALALSYGGICTHFQILDILKNTEFNYLKFTLFRLINGLSSLILTYIILKFAQTTLQTFFSNTNATIPSLNTTIFGSIAILILCIYFILILNQYNNSNRSIK